MVTVILRCLVVVSVCDIVSSNLDVSGQMEYPKSFKDARLFTVSALEDSGKDTTDQWKALKPHGRVQASRERCAAHLQGLADAATGALLWDRHRCAVLTLVYRCAARVRLLSGAGDVLAGGDDRKDLSLEILVDDGRRRVIPLDGVASRELAMLLVTHQQQGGNFEHPDFHIKKQQILGLDFNDKEPKSFGFEECD